MSSDPCHLGYQKLTVDATAGGVALTVPANADSALMTLETAAIRWNDDGSVPTSSSGMPMAAGDSLQIDSDLAAFRAIRSTGSSGVLHVTYYQ